VRFIRHETALHPAYRWSLHLHALHTWGPISSSLPWLVCVPPRAPADASAMPGRVSPLGSRRDGAIHCSTTNDLPVAKPVFYCMLQPYPGRLRQGPWPRGSHGRLLIIRRATRPPASQPGRKEPTRLVLGRSESYSAACLLAGWLPLLGQRLALG
jgi:hypothetical protein